MKTRLDLPGIADSDAFEEIRKETCARIGRLHLCAVFIATTILAAAGCVALIATSVGLQFGGRWPTFGFGAIWALVGFPVARRLSFYIFGRRHLATVLWKRGRCTTCGYGPLEPGVSACCECGAAIVQPETGESPVLEKPSNGTLRSVTERPSAHSMPSGNQKG